MDLAEFYRIEALWRQAEIDRVPDLVDRYSRELNEKSRHLPDIAFLNPSTMPDVFETEISKSLIEDIHRLDPDETH